MTSLNVNTANGLLETLFLLYHSNPRIALALSFGLVFAIYYLSDVAKRPTFICKNGKFKDFLFNSCQILNQRYWPTIWCFGTHAQTVIGHMMRGRLPPLPYQREILELSDGGQVALDWIESPPWPNQPVVVFLPGLTGSSNTEYIKSLVPVAQRLGCRCVVFNNRGRGGLELTTPRTYCAIVTSDLEEVLAHIQKKVPPGTVILATGVSLGGMILGHYLAKSGSNSIVRAAMLISVPWDTHAGCASLEHPGLNLMLNRHLTRNLCDMVRPYTEQFTSLGIDMDLVLQSRTMREFDERFTTPQFGFTSVDDYYTKARLRDHMHKITVPTLCVNAADDMFAPFSALPLREVEQCNNLAMVITARGGHIGFMEGLLPSAPFFSERLYEQYLNGLVTLIREGTPLESIVGTC